MKNKVLFILFSVSVLQAMEQNNKFNDLVVYGVPGQNGMGSESQYLKHVFPQNKIIDVPTPQFPGNFPDLGQRSCQKLLENALGAEKNNVVLHATSQGGATVANYLASSGDTRVKAIVLESPLVSGNSAILHTATELIGLQFLKYIPGASLVVPYAGILACPGYWPGNQQALWSADKLPKDLPIILVHSKNDQQLPFNGTCALYYRLRQKGHKNVYFFVKDGIDHLNILDSTENGIVSNILKHHLGESTGQNYSAYQPDSKAFKKEHDEFVSQERKFYWFHKSIMFGAAAIIAKPFLRLFAHTAFLAWVCRNAK